MSRRCDAKVRGAVEVLLVCEMRGLVSGCRREEWMTVRLTSCGECPEYEALAQQPAYSFWQRADDGIVCSEECAYAFWND